MQRVPQIMFDVQLLILMHRSNRNFNIPPRAFDAYSCPGGREFDRFSLSGGGPFDYHSLASISCHQRSSESILMQNTFWGLVALKRFEFFWSLQFIENRYRNHRFPIRAISVFACNLTQNRLLSRNRHFKFETRLDGHKQCTQNKLCILKMACALLMPVQPRFKSKMSGT